MPGGYLRVRFGLAADNEDELVAELWYRGCLGTETLEQPGAKVIVEAWFSSEVGAATDFESLAGGSKRISELGRESIPAQDWMADYRARALPRPVAGRLIIDPREPEMVEASGEGASLFLADAGARHVLRIPAREAFGTGSHASTRLALEMLEGLDPVGLRVLDVGAGSGILAFAAELFGAGFVVGVEVDPVAAFMAAQNRRLNRLAPSFVAGTLEALANVVDGWEGPGFDLALVNVLPFRIRRHLPLVVDLLAPGAKAVFSGIPREEAADLIEELGLLKLDLRQKSLEDEWVALRMVKRISPKGQEAAG